MSLWPVTAEDVLAQGQERAEFDGTSVRKGSVTAFIANARAFEQLGADTPSDARDTLLVRMREQLPALRAVGVFEVFEVRSPSLRAALGLDDSNRWGD